MDALGARQAPQLRLQVGQLGVEPESAGPAGDVLRRDAGQHEGLRAKWKRSKTGSCAKYHANAPASYFDSIKFWKTPVAECGNGQNDCMDYSEWQQKWTEVTG